MQYFSEYRRDDLITTPEEKLASQTGTELGGYLHVELFQPQDEDSIKIVLF
jgi:hypothetical protein